MTETPKKPSATIKKIVFSGDDSFELKENEKIIIVGPNNSGKSQSLREILSICQNSKNGDTHVLKNVELNKIGNTNDLQIFLEKNADLINSKYCYQDWQIHIDQIQFWQQSFLPHDLAKGFIKKIAADDRLRICDQQNSISPNEQKTKPQHILYDDEELMENISKLFWKAFGKKLMFDFRGGSKLPIHVGDIPSIPGITNKVSNQYVNAVRKNPLLDQQGDGMKSYAGILFEAIPAKKDMILIDEPEAFLHPPQMRRLGETLASEVKSQLIVATHSSDILRGFLEGTQGNIRILRIRREGMINIVSEASSSIIKKLWEKPDLRYSNALEGIFHEQTIICEDDSDCRLINAVADHLASNSNEIWQDTCYVPTGGKHAIPKVATVLRQIGIPIKAVFDIDFLAEQSLVKETILAFGGDWKTFENLWSRVNSAVSSGISPKSLKEIKQEIITLLNNSSDEKIPKSDVIDAMKQDKSWAKIKKYGQRALPNGNAQTDYKQLKKNLEDIGIYLVPVGEIENFHQETGGHGPKFVTKLLSSIDLNHKSLQELRDFVHKVHKGNHAIF